MEYIRITLSITLFLAFFSCSDSKEKKISNAPLEPESNSKQNIIDSIRLTKNVTILWNNKTSRIISDLNWESYFSKGEQEEGIKDLINMISDTTKTPYTSCISNDELRLGDLAFLLIDRIEHIPYAMVFEIQFDVYDLECNYTDGLIPIHNEDRNMFRDKTRAYLFPPKDQK